MQPVQRAGQRFGAALEDLPKLVLENLGVEKLLGVFPFVQRLGFVEPFIALHADHLEPAPGRQRLGQFGLADAGGAFHQNRAFLSARPDRDRGRDLPAGDIARRGQS